MLKWAIENPELSSYLADSGDMLSHLALNGMFIDEECNREVLMNCHVKAHQMFNQYIDSLEAALGVAEDEDARNDYLVNMSYPVDLMQEKFKETLRANLMDNALFSKPEDYTSTCDPMWWTLRILDGWVCACVLNKQLPFEVE
jgi:hypothetical protein